MNSKPFKIDELQSIKCEEVMTGPMKRILIDPCSFNEHSYSFYIH